MLSLMFINEKSEKGRRVGPNWLTTRSFCFNVNYFDGTVPLVENALNSGQNCDILLKARAYFLYKRRIPRRCEAGKAVSHKAFGLFSRKADISYEPFLDFTLGHLIAGFNFANLG